ncbi:CobW family GTP-binding protein [Nocardioides alcanivorans]|uniref:CobW family GTP-binding protein n=1 Tax=Nocardioides alcanivorans TaxID=2897352 RepID=UPI001F25C685|nr:CobW family GTP-binding protein [Nocardioides alcanivorans]
MTVPMLLLGGYLGAGKTTLLNEILAAADGERVALLVNDFGAANIDAALVRARRGDDVVELANGCVCCTLVDGMAASVEKLSTRLDDFDRLIVEVSGVGDPRQVAAWAGHPGFRPAGVVVCADVLTVRQRATDRWVGDTVRRQLRGADLVLLTRTDLVDTDRVGEIEHWVRGIAPDAEVSADRRDVVRRILTQAVLPAVAVEAVEPPTEGPEPADHVTWTLTSAEPVDLDAVTAALAHVDPAVIRMKGVLHTRQTPHRRTVLQVAGGRAEVVTEPIGAGQTGRESTLVVICAAAEAGRREEILAPWLAFLEPFSAGPGT